MSESLCESLRNALRQAEKLEAQLEEMDASRARADRLLRGLLRWLLVYRHDLNQATRATTYNVATEFGYCVCPRCDDGSYNGRKCSLCDGIGWLNGESDRLD